MNTEKNKEKRIYSCPEIISIELDNEISLALESSPPGGPGESFGASLQLFRDDPYRTV